MKNLTPWEDMPFPRLHPSCVRAGEGGWREGGVGAGRGGRAATQMTISTRQGVERGKLGAGAGIISAGVSSARD